jgi:hypothetical protein
LNGISLKGTGWFQRRQAEDEWCRLREVD